jgi:uncharacterized protein (UPF0305 family)
MGLQKLQAGTVSIFNIFPPKQHLHEPRSGIQYRAMTEYAESLIAQLTNRVSSLRRDMKIKKYGTKTKFKKQMNRRRKG